MSSKKENNNVEQHDDKSDDWYKDDDWIFAWLAPPVDDWQRVAAKVYEENQDKKE